MITSFDNNKDKICLLLKNNVVGSCIRSRARSRVRSYDHRSCEPCITFIKL